jgi:hypothetical protein
MSTPCVRNQGRSEISASASLSSTCVVQSITSLPHDPNRGLRTTGSSTDPTSLVFSTCTVRGCGSPAASRIRDVCSLSCVAINALSGFRTGMPSFSRSPTSKLPFSIPSRLRRTSRRASAASPGPSQLRIRDGLTISAWTPSGAASTSLRFVSLS